MINLDEIERRANAATPGPWGHEMGAVLSIPTGGRFVASVGKQCMNDAPFIAAARTDVPALIARVRELEDRLSDTEDRRYRLTQELDEALADYQDLGRVMHEECSRLEAECAELRAECERTRIFGSRKFAELRAADVEQMREYGLSYEGVRKVLHEYNDGEMSFGKLMDLIRAAARAMAEDMAKEAKP